MHLRQPFTPSPDEPCNVSGLFPIGYFNVTPPSALKQPHNDPLFRHPVSNNRLRPELRAALRDHRDNPGELLVRSALEFLASPRAGSEQDLRCTALADLAVTGVTPFARLAASPPTDRELVALVRPRAGGASTATVAAAVARTLNRVYQVAWALRGFGNRSTLGWIAVSTEDEQAHLPVNVPGPALGGRKLPQYSLDVAVQSTANARGRTVRTRFVVAGNGQSIDPAFNVAAEVAARRFPAAPVLSINEHRGIVLYIHGHSSRLEEALDIAPALINSGLQVVSMDIAGFGYSSSFAHTDIGPIHNHPSVDVAATVGPFPALEFIEQFIVNFVDALEAGLGRPIKHQIRAVVGGSLGGNMGLRLAQRSTTRFPWLNTIAAWSPASTWGASWARARLLPMGDGTYMDVGKHEAVRVSRDRTNERESDESRYNYFYQVFGYYQLLEGDQSDRWYRKGWEPCKTQHRQGARFDREEIYSAIYRQWHWRVAHEQLVFMHWEANEPSGHARFKNIQSRLLLGAGDQDNTFPDKLWDNTRELAINMINTQGSTTWMRATGHSIHNERPAMLAAKLVEFLALPKPAAGSPLRWTGWVSTGGTAMLPGSLSVFTNEDGRLELAVIDAASRRIRTSRQATLNGLSFGAWSDVVNGTSGATFTGRPTAAPLMDGKLRMYVRRNDRDWIVQLAQTGPNGSWQGIDMGNAFRQLIGSAQSGPAVEMRVGNGWKFPDDQDPIRLHLVGATLNDGRTHVRGQLSIGYPDGFWTNGKTIGNRRFRRPPVISRNHDGRLEMFNVDTGGQACHVWETSQDNWAGEWAPLLGGVLTGGIAAARNRDGRLEVFGRGTDGQLYNAWQGAPNNGWEGWGLMGGSLAAGTTPSVVLNPWGELTVFVRWLDNSVRFRRQDFARGGWDDWISLGGIATDDPLASVQFNGSIMVLVRGTDGLVYAQTQR